MRNIREAIELYLLEPVDDDLAGRDGLEAAELFSLAKVPSLNYPPVIAALRRAGWRLYSPVKVSRPISLRPSP